LFNLRKGGKPPARLAPDDEEDDLDLPLTALLAKALLAFALHYERGSPLSLAIAANVLRNVAPAGTHVADLPRIGSVSKEAVAMTLALLQKTGYVTVGRSAPAGRLRVASLTDRGRAAERAHEGRLAQLEARWRERFGAAVLDRLSDALREIAGRDAPSDALLEGVRPAAGGWRAAARRSSGCRTFRWCCTAGVFPTAPDSAATASSLETDY
jgi:DNA-binding MarR family transcriptional regulator